MNKYWERKIIPCRPNTEEEKEEMYRKWSDAIKCKHCGYRPPFCGKIPDEKCIREEK